MNARFFPGWSLVGATMAALMLSGTTAIAGTFGLITAHWTDAFGWTQPMMASALSVFLLSATASVPFVGASVDRFGTRRTAICGTIAFAAVLALAGIGIRTLPSLFGFYVAFGLVGAFTNPIVYIAALSAWFDRRRGMALGIAVAGQGLGGALLPAFVETLSEIGNWRWAFYGMAAVLLLAILPLILIFVHDDPAARGHLPDGDGLPSATAAEMQASGITLGEAVRGRTFWIIMLVLGLFGLTSYAITSHLVFLMRERHIVTLPQAAFLATISGVAMILGRIVFGWFLDRFPVPIVGAVGVLFSAAAQVMLLTLDHFGPAVMLMGVLFGASMGAETDLLTLLVGRYFGTRALSRIYSWQNVSFLVGAALGPPLFALMLARFGDLTMPVMILAGITVGAAALLLTLGASPELGRVRPASRPADGADPATSAA